MDKQDPQITVVGVGGAGVNAVARLLDLGLGHVRFIATDTSGQTLQRVDGTRAQTILLSAVTRGLGTGGDARRGAAAVLGSERELHSALYGSGLVFIVAGLAGGTGGGGAPEVARVARAGGAVTIGLGVMPFGFESARRQADAGAARNALAEACDTTVTLENSRALAVAGAGVGIDVALRVADDVIRQAVQGLGELMADCGYINVDLAMVKDLLAEAGHGCLALGVGRGEAPAQAAMRAALASPLADMGALGRAAAVLVQVTGGHDLAIDDTAAAVALLNARLAPGCQLVVGASADMALTGAAQVTVLGTGLSAAVAGREPIPWRQPRRASAPAVGGVTAVGAVDTAEMDERYLPVRRAV